MNKRKMNFRIVLGFLALIVPSYGLSAPSQPPSDEAGKFVRQQYLDFLNREPDADGFAFWTKTINSCGANQLCLDADHVNVSVAFFVSVEFQQTGYLVERMYQAAYGSASGASTLGGAHQLPVPIVRFSEFLPDTKTIGQGVVVGQTGWETVLENNKVAFTNAFVQRPRFTTAFPTTLTPAAFVSQLFANSSVTPSSADRKTAVNEFGSVTTTSNTASRARALRDVAENTTLNTQELNRAFVLMEYFGYLRRNPDDPPEPTLDYSGYDFWLSKLNQLKGDSAELVKAFITSDEYTQRLGAGNIPPINIQEYLPVPETGQTVTVSPTGIHGQIAAHKGMKFFQRLLVKRKKAKAAANATVDLAPLLTASLKEIDAQGHGNLLVKLSGTVAAPVVLNHSTTFMDATITSGRQGFGSIFVISDHVTVTLKRSVIHEPTWNDGTRPAIEVFQSEADYRSTQHESLARDIAMVFDNQSRIDGGTQEKYDGGVRATISLGNIDGCAIIRPNLYYTSGIGITFGGSSSKGNFANHCLEYYGTFTGLPAAMVASVNADNLTVVGDHYNFPGHKDRPTWGGGISGFDGETNEETGHLSFNNLIGVSCDYSDSSFTVAAGNCVNLQSPWGPTLSHDNLVANMNAWGGPSDDPKAPLTMGLLVSNQRNLQTFNITVSRAVQSCIQTYGGTANLFQDTTCNNTGGGGNQAVMIRDGTSNSQFIRLRLTGDRGDPRVLDCGTGNSFDGVTVINTGCH